MPRKFGEIAFTPEVQAAQQLRGSRQTYDRYITNGLANDTIDPKIEALIAQLDGFYLGTVNSNGYPYLQFRGGRPGFLKVINDKTLAFPDFKGNVQYITVGNLDREAKAFLFLMDYRHQERLKIWGKAKYVENDAALIEQLQLPGYLAEIERVILFEVEACSWNCSQHIPIRYSEAEVQETVSALNQKIKDLERQLADRQNLQT
jgi:uncharacterized protein